MEDEKDIKALPVKPAPAKEVQTVEAHDRFPNKNHYEGGYIFNFPVSHYEARTEAEIKQSLLDGGNSKEQTEKDLAIIREGLTFHNTAFGASIPKEKG